MGRWVAVEGEGDVGAAGPAQSDNATEQALDRMRTLLLVDCGSIFTKVALIERVEDRYRLLARVVVPTTATLPDADLWIGINDALGQLERITGRRLRDSDRLILPEREDGAGVAAFSAIVSAGGPLRLLTLGPGRDSIATLLYRALGGLYVDVDTLPGPAMDAEPWPRLLQRVRETHPHGLLIAGPAVSGTQASFAQGWLDSLRAVPPQEAQVLRGLPILFTGTSEDGAVLAEGGREIGAVVTHVPTLAPSAIAPLSRATHALYEGTVLRQVPGFATIRATLSAPVMSSMTALGGIVRYLSRHYQMTVLGVDVGANTTALAAATAQGDFLPSALPTAGVGPGAGTLLRAAGSARVLRWLSFPAREQDLRDYVVTRMIDPWRIPLDAHELEMEHALAREAVRVALAAPGSRLAGLRPLDVILGTGGVLANVPHPAMAALMLLDAVEPRGITSLVVDVAQLAPMLGTAAALSPVAAAELAETDAVPLLLGSVVSASGPVPLGAPMLRVVLDYADGRQLTREIASGAMVRLPLAAGERALLSLYPAPEVDIGLGPGQHARASEPLEGGILGLVIDARGRPITLPQATDERIERLGEWRRALGLDA